MRILLVDDDQALLRSVSRLLRHEHVVVTVETAFAALELVENGHQFDVLLTDYHLPDRTGAQLVALLRSKAPQLAARALIMSGGAQRTSVQAAVGLDTPLLLKPFGREALQAAISGLFAADAASGSATS
jgi:CheY-like chemotaxis protein